LVLRLHLLDAKNPCNQEQIKEALI
jgi:hypothetical protein